MPLLRCITSLNQVGPEAPSQPAKSPATNASVLQQHTTPIQNDAVSRVRRVQKFVVVRAGRCHGLLCLVRRIERRLVPNIMS